MLPDPKCTKRTSTPGPWSAKVDLFRPPKVFIHAPDSFAICRVMTAHYHAETARANAHLIAAAPDMRDALRFVEQYFLRSDKSGNFLGDEEHETWRIVRESLTKAEGR